ncbi:MAG: hypothetical protein ABI315_13555, partial [Bacteroidia bacterium]
INHWYWCGSSPRKERTASFVAMMCRGIAGKTKAGGWFSWSLFLCILSFGESKESMIIWGPLFIG